MKKPAPKGAGFGVAGNDQYFVELLEDDGVLLLVDDWSELLDDGLEELLDDDGLEELLDEELGLDEEELLSVLELELVPGELLELEGEDERLDPEGLPCDDVSEPRELLPCVELDPIELLPCVELLELLSPMVDDDELPPPCTPSAESVCWSSFPEELICCDCWNCFRAERVCGPSWPSICPVSKPLSFRACCASRTVEASFCDDAPCWREAEGCDCCVLADFELLLSFANAAVEESARAAMTRWRSFMVCDFLSGGGSAGGKNYNRPALDALHRGSSRRTLQCVQGACPDRYLNVIRSRGM